MSKTMSLINIFALIIAILFTVSSFSTEISPKFCDNNYIDAVLWDGNNYRLTLNQWIADYNESMRTVGEFVHQKEVNLNKGLKNLCFNFLCQKLNLNL
jgi:hypothetical protein